MVLNISKYHLPYLEYNLFNNYIVKNLCVQKDEENNCCQGKCFLAKQISLVNESDDNSDNPTEIKQINWNGTDDYVTEDKIPQALNPFTNKQISFFVDAHITKMRMDVPCPPPKRFIPSSRA
jgi:hypothetical protein